LQFFYKSVVEPGFLLENTFFGQFRTLLGHSLYKKFNFPNDFFFLLKVGKHIIVVSYLSRGNIYVYL